MQPDDVMEQEESESAKAKLDEQEGRWSSKWRKWNWRRIASESGRTANH
jgi:hypothetical protein